MSFSKPFQTESLELSLYPTVLVSSSENLKVTIVPFKKTNKFGLSDALIQIIGPAAEREGIEGDIIYHQAIPAGNGYNFQIERADGSTYDRISSREAWGIWTDVRVWFGGKNYVVSNHNDASKEVDLESFKKAVKISNA